jgi:hypothetical protein
LQRDRPWNHDCPVYTLSEITVMKLASIAPNTNNPKVIITTRPTMGLLAGSVARW